MLKKLVCTILFLFAFMQSHAYAQSNMLLSPEFWEKANLSDVQRELSGGANVHGLNRNNETPVMMARHYNASPEVIEFLLKYAIANKDNHDDDDRYYDHDDYYDDDRYHDREHNREHDHDREHDRAHDRDHGRY